MEGALELVELELLAAALRPQVERAQPAVVAARDELGLALKGSIGKD